MVTEIPHDRRCVATHNPGRWPYVARCVKRRKHKNADAPHADKFGNIWISTPADEADDADKES